jgi:polyisoprenoid-binding protein YceI
VNSLHARDRSKSKFPQFFLQSKRSFPMVRCAQVVLVLLAGASAAAHAAPVTYKFDPDHTWTTWEARHFGTSTYRGRFDKKEGTVTIDRAAKKGKVEVTIDLTSVNTGVDHLNHHLQEADFFDSEKFPTATFVGEDFRFDGDSVSEVRGQLTLKGKTVPVTLKASGFNCYQHPMLKREVCGGDFSATINRSDWGVSFGVPFVADEVHLLIEVEAARQ